MNFFDSNYFQCSHATMKLPGSCDVQTGTSYECSHLVLPRLRNHNATDDRNVDVRSF